MKALITLLASAGIFIVPYLFLSKILVSLYPSVTIPLAGLLIYTLPLVLSEKSGFFWGLLSGLVWSVSLLVYSVFFTPFTLELSNRIFLSFLFYPLAIGIAGRNLKNKRVSWFWMGIGLLVLIFFKMIKP
jgi:xanthine/uracil/vitamin C permease (AzgA family)